MTTIAANSLRVVSLVAITDAMLVSHSIAETDYTAWNSGTTYAAAARVRVVASNVHKVFESLQAGNLNKDPLAATSADWWAEVSPTNRWCMFDLTSSTVSTDTTTIDVQLTPGLIDTLVLDGIVGTSVRVRMTDVPHGTFFDRTVTLTTRDVRSFTDFFFLPFRQRRTLVLADLPRISGATLRVQLYGGSSIQLATLAMGRANVIGDVEARAQPSLVDYSRKDVDAWGNAVFVERPSARGMSVTLQVPSNRIDEVLDRLDEHRNRISFWAVGAETGYRSLQMLGWPEFDASIDGPTYSTLSMQIKGIA